MNHLHYFANDTTRTGLQRWLLGANLDQIDNFKPLLALNDKALVSSSKTRGAALDAAQPVVILLPGIMGSHLWLNQRDRVWFSAPSLLLGGLAKLQIKPAALEPGPFKDSASAEALFAQFYGDLHEQLQASHRTVAHAYDWRLPLEQLADQLALVLREQLDATAAKGNLPARPVRLVAHSMGGLVVRALAHKHPALWRELMQRDGARLVMLGTPNQGSHLMVETLLGQSRHRSPARCAGPSARLARSHRHHCGLPRCAAIAAQAGIQRHR